MKFDDLDQKMRVYETAADYCVLPDMFMVARLDGRSFTRLTKEVCQFEAPFDERFRDLLLGSVATFDCRISQLPSVGLVVDHFRWRSEDAARNALNAYCYWTHRKLGLDEQTATERIFGLSVSQKNELLFEQGINFNDVPNWQKRGIGFYWEDFDKPSRNPVTGEQVIARRRRIKRDWNLPMKDEYGEFVRSVLSHTQTQGAT